MVRRSTWTLLVIFVILAAFTWWYQGNQAGKSENTPTGTPTVAKARVFTLSTTQVEVINITSSDGMQMELYRDPDTTQWAVRGEPVAQADGFQIEAIIGQLLSIEIQDKLDGSPALESIGLAQPVYTITVRDVDGNQYILHLGIKTPIGTGYYALLKSGEVVVVDNMVVDNVIDLLTNPPLLPTATPDPTITGEPVETVPAISPIP